MACIGEERQIERLEQRDDQRVGKAIDDFRNRVRLTRVKMRTPSKDEWATSTSRDRCEHRGDFVRTRIERGGKVCERRRFAFEEHPIASECNRDRGKRIGMREPAQ